MCIVSSAVRCDYSPVPGGGGGLSSSAHSSSPLSGWRPSAGSVENRRHGSRRLCFAHADNHSPRTILPRPRTAENLGVLRNAQLPGRGEGGGGVRGGWVECERMDALINVRGCSQVVIHPGAQT